MHDGTPWGMIHKQKELNLKHAELVEAQNELAGLQRKVKKFEHDLEQESEKLLANGNIDDVALRKIKHMIKRF
jgi:hypothetical protein